MTLGERIREARKRAGMSQELLAERMEVSRQAVAKWESGRSAPSAERLYRLAEVLGTTPQHLLQGDGEAADPAEWAARAAARRARRRSDLLAAALVAAAYGCLYLLGRVLWCGGEGASVLGFLATAQPAGPGSYLYGWLLSSRLFWIAMAVSVLPALLGRQRMAFVCLIGFAAGCVLGMLFGSNPAGAALGQGHYGWAIWGAVFLLSLPAGALAERLLPGNWLRLPARSR